MTIKKNINKVSQSNNTLENGDIAGRDIYKNSYYNNQTILNLYLTGTQDYESIIELLTKLTNASEVTIKAVIGEPQGDKIDISAVKEGLLVVETLKGSLYSNVYSDITEEYENIILSDSKNNVNNQYVKGIIKLAAVEIKKMNFSKAHQLFSDALKEVNHIKETHGLIYKEYLITGYIHYCRQNDMKGLKSLLNKKRPRSLNTDVKVDYIISNIFQEICSRDTDINALKKAVDSLDKIYRTSTIRAKPQMACSLGLAYRRVGERLNIEYLKKASLILREGLQLNKNDQVLELQLKDHLAITYVRFFEFTKELEHLQNAEELLNDCLEILNRVLDPRDGVLKPRILNNFGNVYKQRVLIFDDYSAASKAISYYEEALEIWNEKDAKYEWGLLMKNLGETKWALGRITNSPELLIDGIAHCFLALKYRNLVNSPYQWAKAVEIILHCVLSLSEMKSINLLAFDTKKQIFELLKQINSNKEKWDANVFKDFILNTESTKNILTKKYPS